MTTINDYGNQLDIADHAIRVNERKRDQAWHHIEASRHGIVPLGTDDYIAQKIDHDNACGAISAARHDAAMARGCYHGLKTAEWMRQDEMAPRKYRLETVWQLWNAVLEAREHVTLTRDNDFAEYSLRQQVDAAIARDSAEGLYDLVLRAFEGRAPRTWTQTHEQPIRVSPPKRPMPSRTRGRRTSSRRSFAALME